MGRAADTTGIRDGLLSETLGHGVAFEALEHRGHGPHERNCGTGTTIRSSVGNCAHRARLRHHYNARSGSHSHNASEEMNAFSENKIVDDETSGVDVPGSLELITGAQGQDGGSGAGNDGGNTTVAQSVHERS